MILNYYYCINFLSSGFLIKQCNAKLSSITHHSIMHCLRARLHLKVKYMYVNHYNYSCTIFRYVVTITDAILVC